MNKRYIVFILSIISFITIMILLLTNNTVTFDKYIYNFISSFRCNSLDYIMKTITYIGNTIPVFIIIIILMMFLNNKNRILLGSSMVITLLINQTIKYIIRRPRPPIEERLITQGGYSFPSGHSMMSLCLYGVLIYLTWTNIKDKRIKFLIISLLSLLILLIGISRIYLRVHYPSDVIAGFLLTISILIINITIINDKFRGNIKDEDVHK